MRDIAAELADWLRTGRHFAMASVIDVAGSAPRPIGTALAVDADGTAVGGVSGGCVEGAVYELCQQVLATGESRIESFGYSDEDAFAIGLTCGGTVTVFVTRVEPGDPALLATVDAILAGRSVAVARAISGPGAGRALAVTDQAATPERPDCQAASGSLGDATADTVIGSLGAADVDAAAAEQARELLARGGFGRFDTGIGEVLVETYPSPPRLLVFGAVDFAAAVVRAGKFLGYRVTVCDARPIFATELRFPEADEVVVDWPHRYLDATTIDERTAVCVLTHDPKFDIPLLERALRLPLGYVGAMGSRRTHRDRVRRLREKGVTDTELAALHSPIGLDLGGRTPEETALSIAAEIVALRNNADGGFLSATDVPIHRGRGGAVEAA
ncbi:XdhC family protein [Stackebrandtia nassauensis]|uniref:Xanthine dehydrogenase n=1 Tax=Stackebrandtia nassauensis (strain DSM 44728 / CIP 108903 / NRRL B-16338 / NBRC 102104 / LLR-40K-21) TaxID=446470 RepID=D3Q650_STANL|nr:XdhC/CoxI family protein [Stackebrandtia nassauensis]ADD42225.1 protein of unknown function DUF182 [Stackebrandtia nassauensis DSM 44728]